jgi:uncharacterized membrane protein
VTWIITLVTYLTGDPAEDTLRDLPNFDIHRIHTHEDTAFKALILSSIISVFTLATFPIIQKFIPALKNDRIQKYLKYAILIGAIIITGLLALAAHQGGLIVHTEIR